MSWINAVGNWFSHEYKGTCEKISNLTNTSLKIGELASKVITPQTKLLEEQVFKLSAPEVDYVNTVTVASCLMYSLVLTAVIIPGGSLLLGGAIAKS